MKAISLHPVERLQLWTPFFSCGSLVEGQLYYICSEASVLIAECHQFSCLHLLCMPEKFCSCQDQSTHIEGLYALAQILEPTRIAQQPL